jgi:hypothetical protein
LDPCVRLVSILASGFPSMLVSCLFLSVSFSFFSFFCYSLFVLL